MIISEAVIFALAGQIYHALGNSLKLLQLFVDNAIAEVD